MPSIEREFAPDIREVASARRAAREACGQWGVAAATCADLALVVSELVTNAVLHAASAVRMVLRLEDSVLRLEVHDDLAVRPVARAAAVDTYGGRGLHVVETVVREWGVESADDGKVVWAVLDAELSVSDGHSQIA